MISGDLSTLIGVWGLCSAACVGAQTGPVLHYDCSDRDGAVLTDKSGRGNDGRIVGGVTRASGPFGAALQFNGTDGYVDCGARPSLDIGRGGTVMFWLKPRARSQGGLMAWTAGDGKPAQRLAVALNTFTEDRVDGNHVRQELGLYISDGKNSDSPFRSNEHKPYFPPVGEWLFYAATFDGRAVEIYRDGVRLESRFQSLVPDTQGVPLWLGRCPGLGGPSDFFDGLMAEIRVYDRPLAEQEVYQVYMETAARRGKATESFGSIAVKPVVNPEAGTIFADLDYRGLAPTDRAPDVRAKLLDSDGKAAAPAATRLLPAWGRAETVFDVSGLPAGRYSVQVTADKGRPESAAVEWPGRAKGWEKVKVLNNFCWELLNETPDGKTAGERVFTNPRRGWVYVESEADGEVALSLPGATPETIRTPDKGRAQEAMRWLEAGEHKLLVSGGGALRRLVVRRVPALLFWHYPHVGPGTGNDHDFLVKHVLGPYNAFHTHDYGAEYNPGEFRQKWAEEQGRHVFEGLYPATHLEWNKKLKDDTVRQQIWDLVAPTPGMEKPEYRGVILDEFAPGNERVMWTKSYYDEWTEVCARILEDPKYAGRFVMPAMGYNMVDFEKSAAFLRMFVEHGSYVIEEIYIDVRDSGDGAWLLINEVAADLEPKREQAVPGYTRHVIKLLSYLQREPWNPAVDFKVHLEMQFEHYATRPEFFGLGGLGAYSSYNCNNEEYVRWVSKLCRHYGLEGKTGRLSADPYTTAQIRNPDFRNGTEDWTLQPAEQGSMAVKSHKGYGVLQERHAYRPWTDTTFLWTKRSGQRPNLFSQEVRNLEAGRLYLVRLWVGDHVELMAGASKDEERAVSIRVEGGEPWDDWYRTASFEGNVYTFASYLLPPFGPKNRFVFKIQQVVFRAKGPTARLVVSDWRNDAEPGGPVGQELMLNFIDVHPYLEP